MIGLLPWECMMSAMRSSTTHLFQYAMEVAKPEMLAAECTMGSIVGTSAAGGKATANDTRFEQLMAQMEELVQSTRAQQQCNETQEQINCQLLEAFNAVRTPTTPTKTNQPQKTKEMEITSHEKEAAEPKEGDANQSSRSNKSNRGTNEGRSRRISQDDLFMVKQQRGEPLQDYIQRFNDMKVGIMDCPDVVACNAFKRGLLPGTKIYDYMVRKKPWNLLQTLQKAQSFVVLEEETELDMQRAYKEGRIASSNARAN
ncbi:hypothetical protein FNV43_RR06085 [Rhamnella rubrinervis]|uniref:Retrotransposon gag domain-containing protein n=1 Tax=Rhamnella rubrinervis TaxID=2594499 RepID=A0A8K0MKZ4_9ROSA|nr:hypothetical protein FNV43_RR06085 [Rhamnella rubrinervis]